MDGEIRNPLAKRLHEQQDGKDIASGKSALEKDFLRNGRARALDEMTAMRNEHLQPEVDSYNADRPATAPGFRLVGTPPRFSCFGGFKFGATFEGIPKLEAYTLRVTVGYQIAVHTIMHDPPEIEAADWVFAAYADDEGFWWLGTDGQKYTGATIVHAAVRHLGDLLVADIS
jgi:hypothetical protein